MMFEENNIDNFFNSQSDLFDKEDDILNDIYKSFRDINNQTPTTIETDYTSFSNDDDEKIPDFIIAEFEDSLKEDTIKKDKPSKSNLPILNTTYTSKKTNPKSTPIQTPPTNIETLDNKWEIISIVKKIVTGLHASIYITLQKYNNNYYVVFTKISNKYNPRHCALPISVANFVADCILEALQNKGNINTQTPTSRKQWFLCKEYGTIFPHPQNYITISHQKYNFQDYIVLTKRDHHKRAKNFAFSMKYAQEAVYALKAADDKGKNFADTIFAIIRPDNITQETNKLNHYEEKMLKCVCGHNPQLFHMHIDFTNRPGITLYRCYCKNCKNFAKETEYDKEKAIFYWNQMIKKLKRTNKNQGRFIKIRN